MPALVEKQEEGRRFRPGLAATLFTVAAVAIMVGLGTWQVERLAWKNALIERIESGMRAAPAAPSVIGSKTPPNGTSAASRSPGDSSTTTNSIWPPAA